MKNRRHSSDRDQANAVSSSSQGLAAGVDNDLSAPFTAPHLPQPAGSRRSAVYASLILLLLLCAGSARAAILKVTTTADSSDGSCGSTCSLRDAMAAASSGDFITFSVGGTITLTSALPAIASNLTIQGLNVTISGNKTYLAFLIAPGVTAVVNGLTIANGNSAYGGAGIYNQGTLTMSGVTLSGNSGATTGGAIYNQGALAVTNSTFVGNSALHGGGIFNDGGTVTVTNCTLYANSGDGIYSSGGVATVSNGIFSGNSGAGIYRDNGTVSEDHNLFFQNAGGDMFGLTSSSTDVTGKDPLLLPLANFGGSTLTMLPQPLSPANCAGTASPANTTVQGTDQRGFPTNMSCVDIGSVQTNYVVVNQTADSDSGSCSIASCTLRAAITQANTAGFGDIAFGVNGTISLASALPKITAKVNVIGPGASHLTLSGANQFHIFNIPIGSGASVFLSGLTLADGYGSVDPSGGGAIFNGGTLTVVSSTFLGNTAPAAGGGILNDGMLTVINSTFSGNSSTANYGGAIMNNGGSRLAVANSTFSGNSATQGGAILSFGAITATNNIFSGNSASPFGGLTNTGANSFEANNLFFNNSGGDFRNTNGGFVNLPMSSTDLAGQDPKLAAIDNYGGPTQTMLPLPGSAAICAGASSFVPAGVVTDQRGYPRLNSAYSGFTAGSPCVDVGAVQTNYQSIQFANANSGYSADANQNVSPAPRITVTENGQTPDGIPVTLSISGSPAASGLTATTANGNGATFNALTVSTSGGFTLSATLNLNPAGSISITTNPTAVLTVNALTSTVTVNNIPATATYGGSFTPAYTVTPSEDTGSRSVASLTTSTCTVSGGSVNFVGVGICTVQASVAATATYAAGTGLRQSFTIGQATATVSISNIPTTAILGGSFTPTYNVTPSGDTGARSVASLTTSTCTVSGGSVNFVGVGTCTLQAAAAATTNYAAATGSQQRLNISYGIIALYSQTSSAVSGSSLPIKVQVTNSSGKNLSSSKISVTVTGLSPNPAPGKAPAGSFTFLSNGDAGPMYQLNVKTNGYPSGNYTLSFAVSGDPVTHTVGFVVQ